MQVKKQELEPDMEQWTRSKLGKKYVKAAYCHLDYLTYMQSISCKMPGWMSPSWNLDCQEQYQQPQICRWYHSNGRSEEELRSLVMRVKEKSEKDSLKLNIQKTKIMAPGPIMANRRGKRGTVTYFIFLGSKILCMVTAVIKLKDAR